MSAKKTILVTDGVSKRGVEMLASEPSFEVIESKSLKEPELLQRIKGIDALIVRSQTQVSAACLEAADALKVVGRAGVGVDNVDVPAATAKGVVVMNTPGGNTISTAEHAFSLLLSMARNIPQAHGSVKAGKWERKDFTGTEICNKTLGIIGMGRIGTEVARRAIAFGMRVLAYDPYLSHSKARSLQVELFENLDELLPQCDFITLHIPMTAETKNLLDARRLKLCKKGVRIVNCARGGLVHEEDLAQAIKDGHVAGAALDVYEEEPLPADFPLRDLPQVVMTPHLGASTNEAQESVGIEIAEAVRDLLLNGTITNAVNMPSVDSMTLQTLRPYLDLAGKLGVMLAQTAPSRCERFTVNYSGKISEMNTVAVTRAALTGFLRHAGGEGVNDVNAPSYAHNLGLAFGETKQSEPGDFSELVSLRVQSEDGTSYEVAGTFFGALPRIVRINGFHLEAKPEGVLLIMENEDRPGIVGWIGTLLGKHNVNIASMSLARTGQGKRALSVLNVDSEIAESVLKEILQDKHIVSVKVVKLG